MFKHIKRILGFALAAGLIAFVSNQAQAGVVIDNQLYSPLEIKLTVSYTNKSDGIRKVRITSKEIMNMLGYPKGSQLAVATAGRYNDIFVINTNTVLANLSPMAYADELLDTSSEGENGQFKYKASGILSINFYSNPQLLLNFPGPPIPNPNWQVASESASDYWFEISGIYSYSEKGSTVKGGKQYITTSFKAGALSGVGHDIDLDAPNPTTVTGRVSGSGSGKVLIETDN